MLCIEYQNLMSWLIWALTHENLTLLTAKAQTSLPIAQLVSVFVIHSLEKIVVQLATCGISII